ncbi:hypothetical protein [Caenimonas koreensis]|uniref:hypothetical protein n=1 Tax=Caenimonas koreensis TaxID=367474 RepID=UPI002B265134|nr:hypothetical protein [Caenimonas koreensis]
MKRPVIRSIGRLAVLIVVIVPVVAWFIVKPVRVIAPQWVHVTCNASRTLCVDDALKLAEALALRDEAIAFVSAKVGTIEGQPRVVFCASQACADSFGLGARSAVTLGQFGTVIGPRAWKPYYVRHELIHYLQSERVGVLPLLFKPQWWVEGMAYALSEDPREKLVEPWEGDRAVFRKWLAQVGLAKIWLR